MASTNASTLVTSTAIQFINKYHQVDWIVATSVNAVSIFLLTWMSFSLLFYGIHHGKWRSGDSNSSTKASAGLVYTFATAAQFLGFIRVFSDLATYNYGYATNTQTGCQDAHQMGTAGYIITLSFIYLFLWLRQRTLYKHPILNALYKNWVRIISWTSIGVILIGLLVSGILYLASNHYTYTANGCNILFLGVPTQWPAYLASAVTTFGQILMLILFAYPMSFQANRHSADRMIGLLKRSALMALICTITDLTATINLAFLARPTTHLAVMLFEINVVVNLVAVYLSFETWDQIMLTPFKAWWRPADTKKTVPSSSEGATANTDAV
uniref:Uncharacterized protein LOC108951117 n=1 Tax=Phallusia mammillata TaxID=59560 RepID=A0A6F9DK73_9ASCI|nr:uncharacterized protein LOC108951117 [Phallusia mammillata]